MKDTPFTELELIAWEHLIAAFNAFSKLEQTHPSHASDFTDGIHKCQSVLNSRVLQRDYPSIYAAYNMVLSIDGRQVWSPIKQKD